jgi:hypothetical protein
MAQPPARPPVAAPQEPPLRRPDAAIAPTPAPQDSQPAARLPTSVTTAPRPRPVANVERRVAQPGDRICGNCGEPNDPTRKFCRRCGNSLVEARIVAEKPLPWWRRIFRRTPRSPQQYAAGERLGSMQPGAPKGAGVRGLLGRLFKLRSMVQLGLGLVVAIGIFGYVGIPSFHGYVDQALSGGVPGIIDKITGIISPKLTIERPVKVTASSEVNGHAADKMFDTFTNTDWQGTGDAPTITVTFKDKINLGAVILHLGNSDKFVDLRRPAKLELDFPDGTTATISPQDVHDSQTFDLGASGVDTVTIRILATNGPSGAPVSISEIEFFRKG